MTESNRLDQYVERFDRIADLDGLRVLDVGAGTADLATPLIRKGASYTAVEPSEVARDLLAERGHEAFASFDDVAGRHFDAAILVEVIEHVLDPVAFLDGLCRVLLPGAIVYLTTPNADSMSGRLRGGRWWAAELPTHVSLYTVDGLDHLFRRSGMRRVHRHRRVDYGHGAAHQFLQSTLQIVGLDGGLRLAAARCP